MLGAPTPILRSFDETKTRRFYLDFLGFELVFEHRFAPDLPLYLGLRSGDCQLHLSEHFGDCSPGARVRIPVDDVRAFAAALRAKNYENARPGEPERMDWGSWELTIHDPSGNRLTFYSEADD
ncbi:VOC family protein [Sphingomonas ginkgonis]|uniref:Bleomycin resistance protein n=1 Tax=Sphingomonas ginkgonis TaxID=2315330 RepID=A0A3R9WTV8_9SPHN|nr:glyoxalase superfamily protein [Sphingomonas ginkgonis]RST31715.1 VOC family protein [Sphingomonas ginkgonis]